MKRLFYILLLLLTLYATERLCHHATAGFAIAKLAPSLENYLSEAPPPAHLFQQSFHYLDKGGQFYVFASEDQQYVLKFFRKNKEIQQTYASAQLAKEKLAEETGLLYLHLGKTKNPLPHLQIVDKLKIAHTIDSNAYGWLLQKRVDLVSSYLTELMRQGKSEEAKEALSALLLLLKKIAVKKIADADPNLTKNFGFVGKGPIDIDVGRFTQASEEKKISQESKFAQSREDLLHWLNAHYPLLSTHFEEESRLFSLGS
jgi:hypothetical protein